MDGESYLAFQPGLFWIEWLAPAPLFRVLEPLPGMASLRHCGGLTRLWGRRCSLTDGPSMVAVADHGSPIGSRKSNERTHHRVAPQHVQHGNFQNATRGALKHLEGRPPRYAAQFSRED